MDVIYGVDTVGCIVGRGGLCYLPDRGGRIRFGFACYSITGTLAFLVDIGVTNSDTS